MIYIVVFILILILIIFLLCGKRRSFCCEQYKYKWSIHTVFIMKENIRWLEEWLLYHITIGVEHFYLYDNTGSKARDSPTNKKTIVNKVNKYGIHYDTISDEYVTKKWKHIKNKYSKYITYIKWQPKDKDGNIKYGYRDSLYHFIKNYKKLSEWVAFTDVDEFIFSKNNVNIPKLLDEQKNKHNYKLVLYMKPFESRFSGKTKYVMDNVNCLENCNTSELRGSVKNIVYLDKIDKITNSMHSIAKIKGNVKYMNRDMIRFNHYNRMHTQSRKFCSGNKKRMGGFDGKDDELLKRYRHLKDKLNV